MTNEGIVVVISSGPPITELDVRFTTRPFIHIYLSISEKYVVVCSIFSIWLIFFFSSAAKSASPFDRENTIQRCQHQIEKQRYPHRQKNRDIHIRQKNRDIHIIQKTGISTSNRKREYPHHIENRNIHIRKTGISTSEKQGYLHQKNRDIHIRKTGIFTSGRKTMIFTSGRKTGRTSLF